MSKYLYRCLEIRADDDDEDEAIGGNVQDDANFVVASSPQKSQPPEGGLGQVCFATKLAGFAFYFVKRPLLL
jgi:hypothetical protein